MIDPDAAGAEGRSKERRSVTANLRFVMLDDPGPFETLEIWEQFGRSGSDAGLSPEGERRGARQVADRAEEARARREAVTGYGVRSASFS